MIRIVRARKIVFQSGSSSLFARRLSSSRSNENAIDDSESSNSRTEFFDVIVCGGGMVGTAIARALGKDSLFKNLKIALIESSPQKSIYQSPPLHSNRTCALSNSTITLLKGEKKF